LGQSAWDAATAAATVMANAQTAMKVPSVVFAGKRDGLHLPFDI